VCLLCTCLGLGLDLRCGVLQRCHVSRLCVGR
jgi:hypothetical protein